jgi:hypothetical protein
MATENVILKYTMQAQENLSAGQYLAVSLDDGKKAEAGHEASGVLMNKPESGEMATIGVIGIMKYKAGGAVTKGDRLTVKASGLFYSADSGSYIVGTARETLSGAGSIGTGLFNFTTPVYASTADFVN